jgi:hypothetical protein
MSVINAVYILNYRNQVTRNDGIEVYGAYKVSLFIQEITKETEIEFGIKNESPVEKAPDPELMVRHDSQWDRAAKAAADNGNMVTSQRQRRTDTYHSLVVIQIVGNRKNEFFGPVHSSPKCDNIKGKNRKKCDSGN